MTKLLTRFQSSFRIMGYNKASLVIPARFIATITHVIIAAIILMTRVSRL